MFIHHSCFTMFAILINFQAQLGSFLIIDSLQVYFIYVLWLERNDSKNDSLIDCFALNFSYSSSKLTNLPNSVGIVPLICWTPNDLLGNNYLSSLKKKEERRKKRKEYSLWSLGGLEESQVTPVCPHKSVVTFQTKVPFEIKELYQSVKVSWSIGSK